MKFIDGEIWQSDEVSARTLPKGIKSLRLGPNFDHGNPNFVVRKIEGGKYMTDEEMMEATRADTP